MTIIRHLTGQKYILSIGDSKSATPLNCWQYPMMTLLEGATGLNWSILLNHSTAGWTAANANSGLQTALDALTITPTYIFVVIGVNDVTGGTAQGAFETAYNGILDKAHAKYSAVPIYISRPWRSGAYTTAIANVNGYIDSCISGRAYVNDDVDERNWLDNWDVDGVHPGAAGYFEYARQFRAVIGF